MKKNKFHLVLKFCPLVTKFVFPYEFLQKLFESQLLRKYTASLALLVCKVLKNLKTSKCDVLHGRLYAPQCISDRLRRRWTRSVRPRARAWSGVTPCARCASLAHYSGCCCSHARGGCPREPLPGAGEHLHPLLVAGGVGLCLGIAVHAAAELVRWSPRSGPASGGA
jgi:hypothetical protein